jgi:hypothetical protein
MLPFNPTLFRTSYPNLVTNWTDEQLTNIWNNEVAILGNKVLSIFKDNTPINYTTNTINSWNATTNTPTLANNIPQLNTSYLCIVAGTVDFGAGPIIFNYYDIVSFNSLLMQWLNVGQPITYYWANIILAHVLSTYNSGIVGRLNQATEGDVSAGTSYMDTVNSTWWNQSPYGARIWQLIRQRGGFTAFISNPYNGIFNQGWNNIYGFANYP